MPPQKLIEIMQISKFARVHVAIPTRRKFDKFLVRHGVVSPTTQISYTYEYRMRQSKTKFKTCASPKKKKKKKYASVRNGKQSLPDSSYILLKTCWTSGCILICTVSCVPFANILLKIHYSFSTKYWLLLCIFLLPFQSYICDYKFVIRALRSYDTNWLFSYVFLLSFLLRCLCHNYYKYLAIEEKKGASEGVVPPQKPGLPTLRNCLEGETLGRIHKNEQLLT